MARSAVVVLCAAFLALSVIAAVADARHHHHDHEHHQGTSWNWHWNLENKTVNQVFSECLCWNSTTSNWCGAPSNSTFNKGGADAFFSRRPCQQLFTHMYWWVIPAVMFASFFVLFPLFFCLSRMLCNCCGGRNPTYGCCCPISNKLLLEADGVKNFKRPYSRCTTGWAKMLALAALITYLTVAIHSFIGTDRSGHSVLNFVNSLSTTVTDMEVPVNSTLTTLVTLTEANLTHVDLATLREDERTYASAAKNLKDGFHDVKKVENDDDLGGRMGWTLRIIAVPLVFIVIVTLLAMCNVRGCIISLFMGLLSFMAFVMVILWIVGFLFTSTLHVACDNYNASFAPFVVDVIHNQKGCGSAAAVEGINRTEALYLNGLCNAGLRSACASGALSCPVNACQSPTYVAKPTMEVLINVSTITQTLALARTVEGLNISACATTASCTAHAYAKAISQVATDYSASVNTLDQAMQSIYNCNGLRSDIQNVIYAPLCTALEPNFRSLSKLLFGLSIVMLITMFIWIYGAKRFTKASKKQDVAQYELLAHHDQPQQGVVVNATAPAPTPIYAASPVDEHQPMAYPTKQKEEPLLVNYGSV